MQGTFTDVVVPVSQDIALREARRVANRRIAFGGHLLIFMATMMLLLFTAGFTATMIVGLAWGIGLAAHGYFGVVAPILRQRWIDEEVNRRVTTTVVVERREVESKNARALGQLSASIAHEIRNPITAAKSLVAQMGEDPNSPENVEYARVALEELDRVERSISHLLKFARDEEIELRPVRLPEVIDSALETFRDRLDKSQVKVARDFDEVGELRADAEKLRRVVINLVGNALDALEEAKTSEPRVDVACGENLARTHVWLRVHDNGPGIPKENQDRVFSPFFTSKSGGTGLGLAISKKLVEGHGGTLEVKSSPGSTELTVTLPRERVT